MEVADGVSQWHAQDQILLPTVAADIEVQEVGLRLCRQFL